jgi:hypothetical protein
MSTERTARRRDPSIRTEQRRPHLTSEPDLSRMSDRELMRRLAMLKPERYGAAYDERDA